jgi:hypothetical protein
VGKFCENFELIVSGNTYIHSQKPIIENFSSQCLINNYSNLNDAIIESSSNCSVQIKKNNQITMYQLVEYPFDEILESSYYDFVEALANLYTRRNISLEINSVSPNSFLNINNSSKSKFDIIYQFESCQLKETHSVSRGSIKLAINGPCGKIIGLKIIPTSGILNIYSNIQYFYSTSIENKIMSTPFYDSSYGNVYFLTDKSYSRLIDELKNSQKAFGNVAKMNKFKAEFLKFD